MVAGLALLFIVGGLLIVGLALRPRLAAGVEQIGRLRAWFDDPAANAQWTVLAGRPGNPTGIHLHFSVVESNAAGGYADETDIANTYDPALFLGVQRNAAGILICDGESES